MPSNSSRRQSTPAPLSHVAYHVLLALATRNRHGYGVIKHVADLTSGRVELEAGTLYAAIKRMKDERWIATVPSPDGEDSRRRTYAITERGRNVLLDECRRLDAMVQLARDAEIFSDASKVGA